MPFFLRLIDISRRHYAVLFAATVAGLIILLPQLLFMSSMGSSYKGIYIMKMDAEEHYLSRMQEFNDGYGLGNPYLFEGKGEVPSASYNITEALLIIPSKIFGIGVPVLNLIYKFLLPALIVLTLYALMFRLTRNKMWSLCASFAIVIGYTLFTTLGLRDLFTLNFSNFPANIYSRPVHPQLSEFLFLLYVHIVLSVFRTGSKKLFILLAACFGLSFYIYFYSFTFLFTLNSLCVIVWWLQNRRDLAKRMVMVIVVGVLIGIPALYNLYALTHHPEYVYLAPISNVAKSHMPVVSSLGVLTLVAFLGHILYSRKKSIDQGIVRDVQEKNNQYFLLVLLSTAFIVINEQVITGILLQEGHYHWYFNIPIYLTILFWLGFNYAEKIPRVFRVLGFFAILILSSVISISGQYNFYKYWAPQTASEQHFRPALNWLHKNTESTDVVLANNALSLIIPIYTQANVSWNYFTLAYLTPRERTIYTLFLYLKMYGITPSQIFGEKYFHPPVVDEKETKNSPGYEFIEVHILLRNYMQGIYPDTMKKMYEAFYALSWREIFSQYRLDYIVWDKRGEPMWNFNQESLEKVFEQDDVAIYRYK